MQPFGVLLLCVEAEPRQGVQRILGEPLDAAEVQEGDRAVGEMSVMVLCKILLLLPKNRSPP
jgi:hypothetical protein